MKKMITALLFVTSASFAMSPSELNSKMSDTITKAGVAPVGHRDYQDVNIICRVPKDGAFGEPVCDITNNAVEPAITTYIDGAVAAELSNIITEFGIAPVGHRDYQEVNVICNTPKDGAEGEPSCAIKNLAE